METLDLAELRLLTHKERRRRVKSYKRRMKRRAAALERRNAVENGELPEAETPSDSKWDVPAGWPMTLSSVIPALRDHLSLTEIPATSSPEGAQFTAPTDVLNGEPTQNCLAVMASSELELSPGVAEPKPPESKPQTFSSINRVPKKEPPRNFPVISFQTDQRRLYHVECPYFLRVGCCPNALRCNFKHTEVDVSTIILLPNMYRRFALIAPSLGDLAEEDFWLYYDEDEVYDDFRSFYFDAISVLKTYGHISKTVVCRNPVHYLRGNVYVEYRECTEAFNAVTNLRDRWYDRQQLSPRFVDITWSNAICEEFVRSKCMRPTTCGLLHPFKNPKSAKESCTQAACDRDLRLHCLHCLLSGRDRDRTNGSLIAKFHLPMPTVIVSVHEGVAVIATYAASSLD